MIADFQELVMQRFRERLDDIDMMCEQMLVLPGPLGVLVEDGPLGTYRVSLSEDVEPMAITYKQVDGF